MQPRPTSRYMRYILPATKRKHLGPRRSLWSQRQPRKSSSRRWRQDAGPAIAAADGSFDDGGRPNMGHPNEACPRVFSGLSLSFFQRGICPSPRIPRWGLLGPCSDLTLQASRYRGLSLSPAQRPLRRSDGTRRAHPFPIDASRMPPPFREMKPKNARPARDIANVPQARSPTPRFPNIRDFSVPGLMAHKPASFPAKRASFWVDHASSDRGPG